MTNDFFERIEKEIEQSLKPQGYRKTKYQHESRMNSNMYSVFENEGRLIRLIWDAKVRSLIVRVYRKRTWVMRLAKVLIGRNDSEKLVKELMIKHDELNDLSEEQVMTRVIETVTHS